LAGFFSPSLKDEFSFNPLPTAKIRTKGGYASKITPIVGAKSVQKEISKRRLRHGAAAEKKRRSGHFGEQAILFWFREKELKDYDAMSSGEHNITFGNFFHKKKRSSRRDVQDVQAGPDNPEIDDSLLAFLAVKFVQNLSNPKFSGKKGAVVPIGSPKRTTFP
jgi:hypothetical protein